VSSLRPSPVVRKMTRIQRKMNLLISLIKKIKRMRKKLKIISLMMKKEEMAKMIRMI